MKVVKYIATVQAATRELLVLIWTAQLLGVTV